MGAPVALFVYNRPEHTRQTVEALYRNRYKEPTDLYIYADGARDETELANVRAVRDYISQLEGRSPLFHVHLVLARRNRGLEQSIIQGVTEIIHQYGRIIVLEDDIVPAPDFLSFMNQALDAYEHDAKVWSISSYTLEDRKIANCKEDVLWTYRAECWGWASWTDRWDRVDWDVRDYDAFMQNKELQRRFNRGGRDMTDLLTMQQSGEIHSWAIRWGYEAFKEDCITVFPKFPKSYNNGLDGSGTNCAADGVDVVDFVTEDHWDFHYDLNNLTLVHAFQSMYRKAYWRQRLGAIWYLLTEYEYCLAYRNNGCAYRVLRPDNKAWYADPIPYILDDRQYVFVEAFEKYKNKGVIGVSELSPDGVLSRPEIILEEPYHLSFPHIFTVNGRYYMMPECGAARQLRIYQMQGDVRHWTLYKAFENVGELADSIAYCGEDGALYFLCCRVNPENAYQTRLLQYRVCHFEDPEKAELVLCWEQQEYTYEARNGGALLTRDGVRYRIAQQSTAKIYGKAIVIDRIEQLDSHGLQESAVRKITSGTEEIPLPQFIYRKWGIHTYGMTGDFEIIDLFVQRFSLGGLWLKVWRRIYPVQH